jgi:hypothetical protein
VRRLASRKRSEALGFVDAASEFPFGHALPGPARPGAQTADDEITMAPIFDAGLTAMRNVSLTGKY